MGRKIGVSLKINVSQIEKARLFAGKKGHYLDATVFIDMDQADQYSNHGMITQDVSKAEKDGGIKGSILGNCKVFWDNNAVQMPQGFQQPAYAPQAAPQQMAAPQQQQAAQAQPMQQQGQQMAAPQNNQNFDNFEDNIPF